MRMFLIWVVAVLSGVFATTDVLSEPCPDIGLLMDAARSIVRIEAGLSKRDCSPGIETTVVGFS
jgi:hypothetical protein